MCVHRVYLNTGWTYGKNVSSHSPLTYSESIHNLKVLLGWATQHIPVLGTCSTGSGILIPCILTDTQVPHISPQGSGKVVVANTSQHEKP